MSEVLDGTLFGPDQPCFGCSPSHPHGFHLRFERDAEGVVTRFQPSSTHQGPPGMMHGGLIATLADEVAAWAIIAAIGKFGFTSSIELRLKQAVRIDRELVARGRVTKAGRRVVDTAVTVLQDDRECAEATLRFVLLDKSAAENLLGRKLPDEWLRFSR